MKNCREGSSLSKNGLLFGGLKAVRDFSGIMRNCSAKVEGAGAYRVSLLREKTCWQIFFTELFLK